MSKDAKPSPQVEPPALCSFACPFAEFPPADTAGLCRTLAAVQCRKLRRLVNKNLPCPWRAKRSKKR